jgi:hypothetical protein
MVRPLANVLWLGLNSAVSPAAGELTSSLLHCVQRMSVHQLLWRRPPGTVRGSVGMPCRRRQHHHLLRAAPGDRVETKTGDGQRQALYEDGVCAVK